MTKGNYAVRWREVLPRLDWWQKLLLDLSPGFCLPGLFTLSIEALGKLPLASCWRSVLPYFCMQKGNYKNLIFISFLILVAVGERLWFDLGANVELITTATILASIYLGRKFGVIVPLIIIALTDAVIGNTNILLFTWSAFALEGLAVFVIARKINFKGRGVAAKLFTSSAMGVGASLWFYIWTNFGVWALDTFGMYPHDVAGLIECYIAGLPFLKLNLFSNLFFVPLGVLTWELATFPSFLLNIFSKPAPREA